MPLPGRDLRWCAAGAAAVVLGVAVVAGARWPGYSHRAQYLSELGQRGAPDGGPVSIGFLVTGALLGGAAIHADRRFRGRPLARAGVVAVIAGFGLSYATAGVARCDEGCPESGSISTSQAVHNAAGAVGYLAAVAGLATAGWALRRSPTDVFPSRAGLVAAPAVAVLSGLAASEDHARNRGLLQRAVELIVFGWIVAVGSRPASERA